MREKDIVSRLLAVALCLFALVGASQDRKECLSEIRAIEEKTNYRNDTIDRNFFMSYSVKVTDWENQVTVSNIKMYKHRQYMHFYTEQVNIFQDAGEVVMILPLQKVAIISSTTETLSGAKVSENFFEMRKEFLDSCEVVRCGKENGKSILELKVPQPDNLTKIVSIIYEYDTGLNKILQTTVNYNSDYKVKQMQIRYKEFSTNSDYRFSPSKKYVLGKNGGLLPRLSGYELIDNRDQKKKGK